MGERNSEESLLSTWAGIQQKVLEGWLDLVQATERPSRTVTWHETMKAWQTCFDKTDSVCYLCENSLFRLRLPLGKARGLRLFPAYICMLCHKTTNEEETNMSVTTKKALPQANGDF